MPILTYDSEKMCKCDLTGRLIQLIIRIPVHITVPLIVFTQIRFLVLIYPNRVTGYNPYQIIGTTKIR